MALFAFPVRGQWPLVAPTFFWHLFLSLNPHVTTPNTYILAFPPHLQSNAKSIWATHTPMDDEELLFEQVKMTTAATKGSTVFVYRCSVYAYPWFTTVRTILDDPAYESWFIKFKPTGPWFSPKCDKNFNPPKCTDYYVMQEQTPGYPHGDGDCDAPGCDCGLKPCGFYLWNHFATEVVNGQTFQQWFIHSYMFNSVGSSPLVSGFFWDDHWPGASGDFPDASAGRIVEDTGMSTADLVSITAAYDANMEVLQEYTLSQGKFAWQMFWTGGSPTSKGSTCPSPLVNKQSCASDLRSLCSPTSPQNQNRTMMYAFSPGGCKTDPSNLTMFKEDLTNFLREFWCLYPPFFLKWIFCPPLFYFPFSQYPLRIYILLFFSFSWSVRRIGPWLAGL